MYYAFTLRKTVSILDDNIFMAKRLMDLYEKLISRLEHIYDVDVKYNYEIKHRKGNKMNLHVHGMFEKITGEASIPYIRQKGFSILIEPCNSKLAWEAYCSKEPYDRNSVEEYVTMQHYGKTRLV